MTSAYERLIAQAQRVLLLHEKLMESGIKNKDIAKALSLYPSAYSTLINKILCKIAQLDSHDREIADQIKEIFGYVNNISETKTKKRLASYIEQLEKLLEQTNSIVQKTPKYIDKFINASPPAIMKMLEGDYHCYYLSSFGYRIKREPLRITFSIKDQNYIIQKGNQHSHAQYFGFGYVSNYHIFTLQLKEANTLVPDNFIAHFNLPPPYEPSISMLKGISLSMSNAYLPISRKVILHRFPSDSIGIYDEEKTLFFSEEEANDHPIVNYLRTSTNFIEYIPIPHPSYELEDLKMEEKMGKVNWKEVTSI